MRADTYLVEHCLLSVFVTVALDGMLTHILQMRI